jgi:hypothetical protein
MRITYCTPVCLLGFILLAGCGGRDVQIVPIKGKVTFGGSPPPKAGKVIFSPVTSTAAANPSGPQKLSRPGNADFEADGSFSVMTYSPGDGLMPGKYRATVMCFRQTPTLDNYQQVSFVPNDFSQEVDVPSNVSSFEVNIDVPATRLKETQK